MQLSCWPDDVDDLLLIRYISAIASGLRFAFQFDNVVQVLEFDMVTGSWVLSVLCELLLYYTCSTACTTTIDRHVIRRY